MKGWAWLNSRRFDFNGQRLLLESTAGATNLARHQAIYDGHVGSREGPAIGLCAWANEGYRLLKTQNTGGKGLNAVKESMDALLLDRHAEHYICFPMLNAAVLAFLVMIMGFCMTRGRAITSSHGGSLAKHRTANI